MEFRSVANLSRAVVLASDRIPVDVDLVVGVPRSGVLAASLIALHRNLRLMDLDGFLAGGRAAVGRTAAATVSSSEAPVRHALIVDDSVASGKSMRAVRDRMRRLAPDTRMTFLAIYGSKATHPEVDVVLEQVPMPRIFEWNLLRHNRLTDSCVAMEGVLFRDGLHLAEPAMLKPLVPVPHLIVHAPEIMRSDIESWLRDQGIRCGRLWLCDEGGNENRYNSRKAEIYLQSDCCLFIDGSKRDAAAVARESRRPVLSIASQRVMWPDNDERAQLLYRERLLRKQNSWRSTALVRVARSWLKKLQPAGAAQSRFGTDFDQKA